MRIDLLSRVNVDDHDHDGFVQRQARRLLDRFKQRVRSLRVRVMDDNGPKGGRDQHCLVIVELVDGRRMQATARAVAVAAAIDGALRKLARLLAEQGKRAVAQRRPRINSRLLADAT